MSIQKFLTCAMGVALTSILIPGLAVAQSQSRSAEASPATLSAEAELPAQAKTQSAQDNGADTVGTAASEKSTNPNASSQGQSENSENSETRGNSENAPGHAVPRPPKGPRGGSDY